MPGGGTLTLSPDMVETTVPGFRLADPDGVAEAIEAREVIERSLARLAALRRTELDVARLQAAVAAMRTAGNDDDAFGEHDLAFHIALWDAAHNELLAGTLAALRELVVDMIAFFVRGAAAERRMAPLADHHAELVDAVVGQDADRAALIVTQMMDRLRVEAGRRVERAPLRQAEPDTPKRRLP